MSRLCLVLILSILLGATLCCGAIANGRALPRKRQVKKIDEILESDGIRSVNFQFDEAINGRQQLTTLDNYRWLMVLLRQMILWNTGRNIQELSQTLHQQGKMQEHVQYSVPFPCNTTNGRSATPPTTVDKLRPGDIDVIGSIGDSLSAGNGILSNSIIQIASENRGITFAGGGIGDWRTYLTLPNILKLYNPKLYGYSTADSMTVDKRSRLNIAEPMIMSRDMVFQARVFIERLRNDPHVDMQNHWKLLTIFLGNNDICSDMCHHNDIKEFLQQHERDLRRAFTLLRDNVPRLLINLIPVPNMVTTLRPMSGLPLSCRAVHRIGCHCVFSDLINEPELKKISNIITRWQKIEQNVAQLPEFNTDDFAVVYQPFPSNTTVPVLPNGGTDLRYFASDCFHFSQRGHASMSNGLWNNMMQPVGEKQTEFVAEFEYFVCPTAEHPYIRTNRNN